MFKIWIRGKVGYYGSNADFSLTSWLLPFPDSCQGRNRSLLMETLPAKQEVPVRDTECYKRLFS